jgi:hypothetical protein
MVVYVGKISVAQAARRLGVGVARVHQRIADGSLSAERIGSQWVVDEVSLALVSQSATPGRPLSERSAWALVAVSRGDRQVIDELASSERSRARYRLSRLLAAASSDPVLSEPQVQVAAALVRTMLQSRAKRRAYRASPIDLPDLRDDPRVTLSGLSHPRSGIASADLVEGYVTASDFAAVVENHLLSSVASDREANVILRVLTPRAGHAVQDDTALLLVAADLADHRRPREEARAAELLREITDRHPELVADTSGLRHPKGHR